MTTVDGRTRHYGGFYGVPGTAPGTEAAGPDAPLLVVYGNCQAEAIRLLLAGSSAAAYRTVRIPPVFELVESDLDPLRRLIRSAQVLLAQPVRDDYRDLPLGTRQVADLMPAGGVLVRWPVVRSAVLHPFQAIIRDPRDGSREPPVVPYHDLRTVASAASGPDLFDAQVSPEQRYRAGQESVAELRRRELAGCDVRICDLFERPRQGDLNTINHPGNRVLVELARRLQSALGAPPDATDPGRELLGSVRAPVEQSTLDGLGLDGPPGDQWVVDGRTIGRREVHEAQLDWYRANPWVVQEGLRRHETTLHTLGLR